MTSPPVAAARPAGAASSSRANDVLAGSPAAWEAASLDNAPPGTGAVSRAKAAFIEAVLARRARPAGERLRDLPLASMPHAFFADLDVARAIAQVEPAQLARFSCRVLMDAGIAQTAVKVDPATRTLFPAATLAMAARLDSSAQAQADEGPRGRALAAVRANPMALKNLSAAMRNDAQIVSVAAQGDPAALAFASRTIWLDAHFIGQHLPSNPGGASRVLATMISELGDEGTADLMSNHHVATLFAQRVPRADVPPATREAFDYAVHRSLERKHPGAVPDFPSKPTPFTDI